MGWANRLWTDDAGVLLSAEAVVVGTVAVVGLTAGMSVVASSVNEELRDVGFAIRSLDQSYHVPAQKGCGAMTAASSFRQEPVRQSLQELDQVYQKAERQEKAQAERLQEQMKRQQKNEKSERDQKGRRKKKEQERQEQI